MRFCEGNQSLGRRDVSCREDRRRDESHDYPSRVSSAAAQFSHMTTVAYSLSHAFLAPSFSRRGSRPVRRARRAPPCPPPRGFGFENEELTSAEDDVRTDVAVGISGHTRTGGEDVMDEARVIDPYGLIQDVMSSPAQTLTPGLELNDPVVRQSLQRYHGLPVVSAETGKVVGVISRSDVRRLGDENAEAYTVGEAMSSPPVCVRPRAHIAEAAGMMLQHKVHRLPVVDDRSVPVGVATRQDVFEPLVAKRDEVVVDQQTRRYDARLSEEGRGTPSPAASGDDDVSVEVTGKRRASTRRARRVRVAAKPYTRPHAFRRDAPLTCPPSSRSPSRSPASECGEAEEAQAMKRARKLAEGFEEEDERWALDVDVDGA